MRKTRTKNSGWRGMRWRKRKGYGRGTKDQQENKVNKIPEKWGKEIIGEDEDEENR